MITPSPAPAPRGGAVWRCALWDGGVQRWGWEGSWKGCRAEQYSEEKQHCSVCRGGELESPG